MTSFLSSPIKIEIDAGSKRTNANRATFCRHNFVWKKNSTQICHSVAVTLKPVSKAEFVQFHGNCFAFVEKLKEKNYFPNPNYI